MFMRVREWCDGPLGAVCSRIVFVVLVSIWHDSKIRALQVSNVKRLICLTDQ